MRRTPSGEWRAVNMIRSAPTKGAHVMTDSAGKSIIVATVARQFLSSLPPLHPHHDEEHAERHPVHVVLRLSRLQVSQAIAGAQTPRAEDVQDAVDQVAIDPPDEPREEK